MRYKITALLLLILFPVCFPGLRGGPGSPELPEEECSRLYGEMNLAGTVTYEAFRELLGGYHALDGKRGIVTLVDFSRPSEEERLYVFDLEARKILFRSLVAHGRGSGGRYATSFSNEDGSHKSSLGFYITAGTYNGANGYSLILDGLEKGINDRARQRAIVIHQADYCTPGFAAANGRLGRSLGCPALPPSIAKAVIDTIKGGTLLYIYAADNVYRATSKIMHRTAKAADATASRQIDAKRMKTTPERNV